MKRLINLVLIIAMISMSSCVALFMPAKQKVTINTGNEDATVYVNNIEYGKGSSIVRKIRKEGVQQVVVQAPDHKDEYYVLLPVSRPIAYYPMLIADIPFLYALYIDPYLDKGFNYNHVNYFPSRDEFLYRQENQKYISLDAIKLDIKDTRRDDNFYEVRYSNNLTRTFKEAEIAREAALQKREARDQKRNRGNRLETEDNKLYAIDTQFSANIQSSLKDMGYVDTVNKVFRDFNNTLILEGAILKSNVFRINSKQMYNFGKARLDVLWRVKNSFGELIDSLMIVEYSGDFAPNSGFAERMYTDAVNVSFYRLLSTNRFVDLLKMDDDFSIKDSLLVIPAVTKGVAEVGDALEASVIIKQKDGNHGSGFVISNDGYILTNFHVIAGKTLDKQAEISVILSSGEEIPVEILRFNRMRDVALLKVDHKFENAFSMPSEKGFKSHQEVYAAGAPRSIELGQSVSLGLISNERVFNKNTLLQLSMSVNPGNSGGPLFERSGQLHGIVTSKLVGYATEGIGFAIPAYLVADYLNLKVE